MAKVEQKGTLSNADLREFFREMLLIRRFEEKVEERFRAGELPGFLHVAIGQEAVAVGVCRALEEGDIIASTHRAHGHTLAKGTTPNELMAELYGKQEGCSHGFGGSMHLYDIERGNMGANAVVGGGLGAIVGSALAFKLKGERRVAVAFFGDGATNTGAFHEAMNLAQLWHVPAVFRSPGTARSCGSRARRTTRSTSCGRASSSRTRRSTRWSARSARSSRIPSSSQRTAPTRLWKTRSSGSMPELTYREAVRDA